MKPSNDLMFSLGRRLLDIFHLPSPIFHFRWFVPTLPLLLLTTANCGHAATHYVWQNSPSPLPPYTNWATAATNIQDAVDQAQDGDTVLVSGGVYSTGGRAVHGAMINRVAIDRAIRVESLMGPEVTIIQGRKVPGDDDGCGDGAIRCVYLTNDAVLSGFTLTDGATLDEGDWERERSGGGVWCESTSAVVTNCILTGNSADTDGGGSYNGTLNNCTLTGNSASEWGGGARGGILNNCTLTDNTGNSVYWSSGGGAYWATLNNCTITENSAEEGGGATLSTLNNCILTGNWADWGGGAAGCELTNCVVTGNSAEVGGGVSDAEFLGGDLPCALFNCIVYYNKATTGMGPNYFTFEPGWLARSFYYCCTTPLPANGVGNINFEPQLASATHLNAASPCIGAGSPDYTIGVDIDGEPWVNPPSMGCDELYVGSVTGALKVSIRAPYTNVVVGYSLEFTALIEGRTAASKWDFGDGVVVSNRPYASHAWTSLGEYTVVLTAYNESHPSGVSETVAVQVVEAVHYVSADSASPEAPYASWGTAATDIQSAIDAASVPGALVLVTNGVYDIGGRTVEGTITNRVTVDKPLRLLSVNGPAVTTIQGFQVPGTTNGEGAVRCVYLANNTILGGFTLTTGAADRGGAVWCRSTSAVLTNCVISGNFARDGGGAFGGTLNNCTLTGNSASRSGGAADGWRWGQPSITLNNCTLTGNSASERGGGASYGTLNNCTLTGNSADYAGGAGYGTLNDCVLAGNSASFGGGAGDCVLNNCTLTGNSAASCGGASYCTLFGCTLTENSSDSSGGGATRSTLYNCILAGNSAGTDGGGAYLSTLYNCTLTGNSASNSCGGAFSAYAYSPVELFNCVLYNNTAPTQPNYGGHAILHYSCTIPLPQSGIGNITNTPLFVDTNGWSDLRLQANSPCINAGNNDYVASTTDLDGNPRIIGGTVDIGAYEFQGSGSVISYAWLKQFGLPTDGSVDFSDLDSDFLTTWQEWRCQTCPTNYLSALRLLSPSPKGSAIEVTWESVAGVEYFLERGTNLGGIPAFAPLATSITGQPDTTTFTDTNAPTGPVFYRLGVQ